MVWIFMPKTNANTSGANTRTQISGVCAICM